jgi:hypothetical protein
VKADVKSIEDPDNLFFRKIPMNMAKDMVRPVSRGEIKVALGDIDDDKAPGLNGYTARFFKVAWGTVGNDVCDVVLEFFNRGNS